MDRTSRIFVAGHKGMVGSAIHRQLVSSGFENIITRTRLELDLTRQEDVENFFRKERPEYVFLSAAKVGGILANSQHPADFIYTNIQIQNNVIHCAHRHKVLKLLFLGSSCIYPRDCPQPMKEEYLLTGSLEKTNEAYAIAKISGIKMCQFFHRQHGDQFFSVMPTNLYGPNDNFHLQNSHVLPALMRKFHEARRQWESAPVELKKQINVTIWGTGNPRREFLHVDDLADACIFTMNNISFDRLYKDGISHLNIGVGKDISISELANLIREIVGFEGDVVYDRDKPDGTPIKLLDVSKIHRLGWRHRIELKSGIEQTYTWFLNALAKGDVKL